MKENLFEKLQNELIGFMHMCSQEDLNLLICEPKEKTIDDFARLFCLGVVFDLRGVFNCYKKIPFRGFLFYASVGAAGSVGSVSLLSFV